MIMNIDERRIEALSLQSINPIYQDVLKIQEEVGELSQAFLAFEKSPTMSKSAETKNPLDDVLEETCDCINSSINLMNKLIQAYPEKEIYVKNLFNLKLDKWEEKLKVV